MFKSLLFLLVLLKLHLGESSFKRVCYYSNWSQNRKSGGEFFPEDIDPSLCSHVIFAFGKIANKTIVGTLDNDLEMDGGPGLYTRIMVLKQINPKLRILLAIGGWDEGSTPFESVLDNDSDLQTFSDNAVKFLRKWNFDGLDVDWEFPILNKIGFTKLLESLRLAFDMDAIIEDRPLILTAAVSAGQATIDTSYDIVKMEQFLDFINLMAYDLHTSWETKIGYHSALYAGNNDKFWEKTLNTDWAVNYWIGKGMPSEKIVLGLALYGRGYTLANPSNNQPGAASKGASLPGNYTNEAGVLSYFEICELIGQKSLTENYDDVQKIAWIQSGSQWIGYDNENSLLEKATYIKNNCLGGFMIWTVDFDDYNGKFCKRGKYPLLKALNEAIVDATCSPKTTTTTQPSTTVISSTQTIASTTRPVSTTTTTTTTTTSTKVTTTTTKATTSTKTTTEAEKTTTTTNSEEHQIEPSVPPSSTTAQSTTTTSTTKKTTTTATTIEPTTVLTTTTATSSSGSTKSNEPDTDFRSNDSYEAIEPIVINYQTSGICTGSELVPSNKSCFHYEVCLKGFRRTVALLQCPEDKWFNPVLSTCVANPPKNCTKLPATTTTSSTTKSTTTKQSTTKTTTTEATTTTAAEQPEPEPEDSQTVYDCQGKSGTFKYNGDCQQFWHCSNGIPYLKKCPGNLLYNNVLGICDYVSPLCPSKKTERRSVDFLLKKYYKQI